MSIYVKTSNPRGLLQDIKKEIDSGAIDTWSYDWDGDFTHTPEQWKYRAWLRPVFEGDRLKFSFIWSKNYRTTKMLYAIYHWRYIEMLLAHFDKIIQDATATAMPTASDQISKGNE